MFFNDLTQRKLASLLQPWLQGEPDLQVESKLGFLPCHAVAKNLHFNASALNDSFGESTRFSFHDVIVDELSLSVSYCSHPAFTFEVRGVHITLLLGEASEQVDTPSEDKKKLLYESDPEGFALHDAMERILRTALSGDRTSSLLNIALTHCRLQMQDIHLILQSPSTNDSFSCFFKIKELTAESRGINPGCFLPGFVCSLLVPSRESHIGLDIVGFEFGLKSKDGISSVFSSTDLLSSIKLRNLRFISFKFYVPELDVSFSPADLSRILVFNAPPTHKSKYARNGRQLWDIAAIRVRTLVSTRRWSLQTVVHTVCLWLRYVHAYENLLLVVGYPVDSTMERSALMMSCDKMLLRSVEHHWGVISEIEKELPIEAIALARRVIRYRAARKDNLENNIPYNAPVNTCFKVFQNILVLFSLIWMVICSMFKSTMYFILYKADHPKNGHRPVADLQRCFSVNTGKISITITPENALKPEKSLSDLGISYSELLSFCLSVDGLFLMYKEKVCEQCFSFSCGPIKVSSFSVVGGGYQKGRLKKKVYNSKTNLWGKPARIFDRAETTETGLPDHIEGTSIPLLESLLWEMWLGWKQSCTELEESKSQYLENPSILCDIKSLLTDQAPNNRGSGFLKCCMVVGELNLFLEYLSILSLAVLLRQIRHALHLTAGPDKVKSSLCAPSTFENSSVRDSDSGDTSYASRIEMALHKILPQKLIQIGIFIAGPHIQISLGKESHSANANVNHGQDDLNLAFDVHNIELAAAPTLASDLASSSGCREINYAETKLCSLKEPEIIDIPNSVNELYRCQGRVPLGAYLKVNGLKAYLDDSTEKQQYQICVLNPTTIELSSTREELHSFGITVVAVSAALRGIANGLTLLLFLDEISVLVEVVVGLTSAVFRISSTFDSADWINSKHVIRQATLACRKGVSSIFKNTMLAISCTAVLKSMDVVLHKTRRSTTVKEYTINFDSIGSRKLAMRDVRDQGICAFIQQWCAEFSCKETNVEVSSEVSGIRAGIFEYANEMTKTSYQIDLSNFSLHSLNCLYEVSSSECKVWVRYLQNELPSGDVSRAIDASTSDGSSTQDIRVPASSRCLLINISLGDIYIAECALKHILVGAHHSGKLESSLSVGAAAGHRISCQTQGGLMFLETKAVVMLSQCFTSYYDIIERLLPVAPLFEERLVPAPGEHMDHPSQSILEQVHWEKLEAFAIDLSQLSLALVARDEYGRLQELLFEADFHVNLEATDTRKKVSFHLSRMSIFSHILLETVEYGFREIQITHFPSPMSGSLSSKFRPGDPVVVLQNTNRIHSVQEDASCSSLSLPPAESHVDNIPSQPPHLSPENFILRHLTAFMSVEKPMPRGTLAPLRSNQLWIGGGSISGFDVTISLPEIQIILSVVESLTGVFSKEATGNVDQRQWLSNQETDRKLEEFAPDGTIVAMQDVQQHMYITVEGAENKYSLVGATHYSLVGERALFRVKYHYQRRWKSPSRWFSLTSLHAKSDSGEPLQLKGRPGSSFVDISSSNDSGWGLWGILPSKPESYEGDSELASYSTVAKNMFHLVNRKNDSSLAFVDGILEFVGKPGNLFKWKVFYDLSLARENLLVDSYLPEASKTNARHMPHLNEEGTSGGSEDISSINVKIEKLTLTIVHELSDTKEKFPLLQGCITITEFIVQILYTKARVMSRFWVELKHFDAQRNLWREFIRPAEHRIFYRSRFQIHGSEVGSPSVPVYLYASIKELDMSITELSLDILLFVIGKLNLAGPFAVRSSVIFASCCKVGSAPPKMENYMLQIVGDIIESNLDCTSAALMVAWHQIENQTGLTLLAQFYDKQAASVARNQSTTIFLRHLALVNQDREASFVSLQLADQGASSTLPIHCSLLEARTFAWRTRIASLQDSKTYPGPFVVVKVSQRTEDGLSIAVSPLLRIHNATDFSMKLRFRRTQQKEAEFAFIDLKAGDTVDDSMTTFRAIKLSGGLKKALMSASVGNFLLSFRPEITENLRISEKAHAVDWSDELESGKAVRLSGLFDKLGYRVRKAFSVESVKCSFSTEHCSLRYDDGRVANLHFLIQSTRKDVPVVQPDGSGFDYGNGNTPLALQVQKEIFLLPTVRVSNLLHLEIHVHLTDKDPHANINSDEIGRPEIITCGSTANLYADPASLFITVTLAAFNSSSKPVNSGDWVRKLQKQKDDVHGLNIELEFGGGKYCAILRLSYDRRGILEALIFTSYTLKNDSDFQLFCFAPNQKRLSRDEVENLGSEVSPDLGSVLPPKSTKSWFMKYSKLHLKLLVEKASEALLDLDALSGLTEIDLKAEEGSALTYITRLGVSLRPSMSEVVPSQTVSINPRYVVLNESEDAIIIRQCYLEGDMERLISIKSKEKKALQLRHGFRKKREFNVFENFLRKHRNDQDDSLLYIQFRPNQDGWGWSGPVCVASLGRFFLKFRRSIDYTVQESNDVAVDNQNLPQFAAVHVVEEGSSLVLRFNRRPNIDLPYRIENCLHDASITFYQKGSMEPEILGSGRSVNYVWDDLTLPRKLVIQIDGLHLLREINLDKVRAWKPIYRFGKQRGLGSHLPLGKKFGDQKRTGQSNDMEMVNLGYEIYADGPTRVLRVCEFSDCRKGNTVFHTGAKMRLRISYVALHLMEHAKQKEVDTSEPSVYTPILVMRVGNINLDSVFTGQRKINQIRFQSLSVDQKWVGAPFAAMLRRHQQEYVDINDSVLHVLLILLSSRSNVKQVKYLSIVLQPLDLNVDEETLMKIVPFWRKSLSDPNTPSWQYYFDHFEIHPIKIIASFLPGGSYSSYSSTQETLRSLVHSVIKIPAIKKKTVELNGVLVTHALISIRELSIKCAQHYSWYAMRAIYIAKGSPLLPPTFASIFDDLASSSLDVFFDPSSGLIDLPGLTLGTFKLISKCIDGKGFFGTKRYFGDLRKTLKTAGSNVLFAAVTEVSDSVLKGAETSGFNGMVSGFHQGILKLAMEPSVLGSAFMEGGPDCKIKLDRNPGIDELYIEGYMQAMLDTIYKQEYLRVRVIDNQVVLKNLPPNSSLIEEIMDRVKGFLVSKALLKGDSSTSHSLRHLRGESEWKIGPTVLTLCEHLFVSFAIRVLRKQAGKVMVRVKMRGKLEGDDQKAIVPASTAEEPKGKLVWKWGLGKFVLSGIVAYLDGRLCRSIPNPVARRIVSGFLLSFLDKNDDD